jgi:hypothetical protein
MAKTCRICKQLKELSEFPKRKDSSDRHYYYCHECCRQKQSQYYHSNRKRVLENLKHRRDTDDLFRASQAAQARKDSAKLKMNVLVAYSNGIILCACCGESDIRFLTLDHINGGGNQEKKKLGVSGGEGYYRWLRRNGYPPGLQVLCFNCNQGKAIYGECPHRLPLPKTNLEGQ